MPPNRYIAHTRNADNETQSLKDHLNETAKRAHNNASSWGAEFAFACGLVHDIGKYSAKFQDHIRGKRTKVDHSTAGGKLIYDGNNPFSIMAAYCILGHHTGLQNGGSKTQPQGQKKTLYYRLDGKIEDYEAFREDMTAPQIAAPPIAKEWASGFDAAFFVRMVFSALVDADWLDTEAFCYKGELKQYVFSTIRELEPIIEERISKFLQADTSRNALNERRNKLLSDCIRLAAKPSGLFTLTAPTGSGKTIASLTFAVKHANKNNLRRIIYIAPYNTIIEQNAGVYEEYLGIDNVLQHNSDAVYDDEDETSIIKRRSVENWNCPIIVTSSVQFFESLFAHKKAKCRKLHNIANSVLIFDEAQMIPVSFLKPCVKAIETLVTQYGCTAVLTTATQSSLDKFFTKTEPIEITTDSKGLYTALQRAYVMQIKEPFTYDVLAQKISEENQVLCIVNTRKAAQSLFRKLKECKPDHKDCGLFHLSTTMYPAHRKYVLDKIRTRLNNNMECTVISTSLVEAGVDLDFETVYREQAGLDSIVQAAGRCNREGKRELNKSNVYVFTTDMHKPPRMMEHNIAAFRQTARKHTDIASLDAIDDYFTQLHGILGHEYLDNKKIIKRFDDGAKDGWSFPFADIGKDFKLIDDSAGYTVYVLRDSPELEEILRCTTRRDRMLFRELSKYAVSLYEYDFMALKKLGAIEEIGIGDERIFILYNKYYDNDLGVDLTPSGGHALIL